MAETGPSVTIDKVDGNDLINFAEAHAAAGVALTGTVTGLAAGSLFNVMVADNGVTNTYIATVNDAGTGWDRHHPDRGCVGAARWHRDRDRPGHRSQRQPVGAGDPARHRGRDRPKRDDRQGRRQ